MNKYPNSGRLSYSKNKINPKSPDLWGELVLERSLLRELLDSTDEDSIPIKLDAWQYESANGSWFSLKVNTYKKTSVDNPYTPPKVQVKPVVHPADDSDVPF